MKIDSISGCARLMTALWWVLWPTAVVAEIITTAETNQGLLWSLAGCSLLWTALKLHKPEQQWIDALMAAPYRTVRDWAFLLLLPWVHVGVSLIPLSAKHALNHYEGFIVLALVVLAALYGIYWVLRGFFARPKAFEFNSLSNGV